MNSPRPTSDQRLLSPLRKSSTAQSVEQLVDEQLAHFGIDPDSPFGKALGQTAARLYLCQEDLDLLWRSALDSLASLPPAERIARFNGLKFLSFQLAKLLDTLQNPSRASYQHLRYGSATATSKGPYAVFDNVTALFSATPAITRTATYIYACAEWIEDAFQGRELLLEIYSRLLNPTSISLANYIVDLEAGPHAADYLAWNFSSGMAAIDATLAHVLGRDDILLTSRNIYGGAYQLIHDWYAKNSNLDIAVETFDGATADDLIACYDAVCERHADRLAAGRQVYVYLESPSNPHGDVLDVPGMCRAAHHRRMRVMLDATVGTPFLSRPLAPVDPLERPDFVIHSYTKDLSGSGSVVAGVVIGRNYDMFIPKGQTVNGVPWNQTMFWNVYYVKGAFLNADSAFEVIQGLRTLEQRMLAKCVNTQVLVHFLAAHPAFRVHSNLLPGHPNAELRRRLLFLELPAPLFTVDMPTVPRGAFQRFFDNLSPTFGHMISLGQTNTIVSCPALTTHSELDEAALGEAGITPTTIRFAVGNEEPFDLLAHLVHAARLTIDPEIPGFSAQFPTPVEARRLIVDCHLDTHRRYIESKSTVGW